MSFLLKVISNREAGIEYPLQQGDNLVGRSRSADIRVQNEDVSGKHFIIKVTGNSAELVNLSHYGTGLDGFTIQDKSEILPGQTIEAGKSLQFVFTQLVESEPEEQEVSDETGVTRFAADIDRQPSEEIYENDTPEAGEETGVTRFAADIDRQASEEDMPEVGEETGVTRLAADISPHNAVAEAETDEEDMTSATRLASAVNINENETVLPHDASVRKESQGGGEITGIGTIAAGVSLQGVIEAKNSSAPAVNLNDTFVDEDESFGDATETGTRIEATVSDHTSATDGRTKNTAAHGNDLTPIDDATFFQDDDSDEGEKTNANETQVVQTRMANLDEISFIKNQIKKQQQSRLFFKFLIFILLVVFFGIIWILKAPQQEKTLSWPQVKEANGALTYATGRLSAFEIGTSQNGFDVYYPKWPNTRIEVKDPSCTVIHTSLGRAADVPLTIILQREESDEFIYENRGVAMKNMLRRLSEKKDELFNFDGTPNMLFLVPESGPAGNGVLCNMIAYQRDAGEYQF